MVRQSSVLALGLIPAVLYNRYARRTERCMKLCVYSDGGLHGKHGCSDVRPVMDKLGQEDQARFQAAYCGLCYELGRQYGAGALHVEL